MGFPMCVTKKRYYSEELALSVAARCVAARGVPLRPYWCGACQAWHLTKTPPLVQRAEETGPASRHEASAVARNVARAEARKAQVRAARRAAGLQQAAELLRRNGWTCIPPEDCA